MFSAFAASDIADDGRRDAFLSWLDRLGITAFAKRRRDAMRALADRGIDPFDTGTMSLRFNGVFPGFSFSVVLEPRPDDSISHAARLAHAALRYRHGTSAGRAGDEPPLLHLFGRTVDASRRRGRWTKRITDSPDSRHIAVAVRGRYFRLPVVAENGTLFDAAWIAGQLRHIVDRAVAAKEGEPYGVWSAAGTDLLVQRMKADPDPAIRSLDEALFLLALDLDRTGANDNEAARAIHVAGYRNRDYRKALQIVVLGDGRAGIVCNLFAGVEGVAGARFASWLYTQAAHPLKQTGQPPPPCFSSLEFRVLPQRQTNELERKIARLRCDLPFIKQIGIIGREGLKALGVSPDAFFHAAMHLAYYRRFGRPPFIHNFADMRALAFGSITRYLSTTREMTKFAHAPSNSTLIEACAAHGRQIAAIKAGDHPAHYIYHYLLTCGGLRPLLAMVLFRLFVPDVVRRHLSPDIWASSLPALDGLACEGRFGVHSLHARKNGLVGHYMQFPDRIVVSFASKDSGFLRDWDFPAALESAMVDMIELLQRGPRARADSSASAARAMPGVSPRWRP